MNPATLTAEAVAVRLLASELEGEDLDLSIESETAFKECVARVVDEIRELETMGRAIADRQTELAARAERYAAREQRLRDVLVGAFATAGVRKLPLVEATVSLVDGQAVVKVIDEAAIPAEFWREKTVRMLDRRAVAEALKDRRAVPGATLDNRPPK